MAEGFRSAGFPLGLSSPAAPAAQSGFRSLLAFWMGGACLLSTEEAGGHQPSPRGKQGYNILPEFYRTNTDEKDIITFLVAWAINHG